MCLFEVWWNWDTPSLGPVQDVLKHPQLENTECGLRSGCPVVRKDHALALITEIEHMEMEKRTNHRLTLEEPTEKTKKWWGSRFPETPERIWNYMKGQDEEDPQMNHDFPWNRHKKEAAHLKRGYSPPLCWGTGEGMAKESHQWIFFRPTPYGFRQVVQHVSKHVAFEIG